MRTQVRLLDPQIAEKIAAGEVIERPASVVKELVENSLDAGAQDILIQLEEGGQALIEVTDNGFGMSPEDLQLCVARHATSKLLALEDLDRIATLGFRGEALPSIAAVADLSLISRVQGADSAYEWAAHQVEKKVWGHFLHSSCGTKVRVRGLFEQIPARLKFLRSASAEVAHIREWIERLAIAYPHVGFCLRSGNRTVLEWRPQDEKERVLQVLGTGEDFPVLTASTASVASNDENGSSTTRNLRIRIHWLQGLSVHTSRRLVQVVNGRAVRDRLLQQAVLQPFRQRLLPGQCPALALRVDVDPATLDVNVHPSKTEVRFLEGQKIFREIEKLVQNLIQQEGAPARVVAQKVDLPDWTWKAAEFSRFSHPAVAHPLPWQSESPVSSTLATQGSPQVAIELQNSTSATPPISSGTDHFVEHPASPSLPAFLQGARPLGILFQTYLLYEQGQELIAIDQHAAHERIRYEKLMQGIVGVPQSLLIPETLHFVREDREQIEVCLPVLSRLGFEVELFSDESLLFRAVPSEWGSFSLKVRLKNLIDRLLTQVDVKDAVQESATQTREVSLPTDFSSTDLLMDETLFETLASEACHSAVRAGDALEPEEGFQLFQSLFQCKNPWNCPHGRPTVVRISEKKFEDWFQRTV